MKKKIVFLTTGYFPDENPQSILLKNIINELSKKKNLSLTLFTNQKKPFKSNKVKYEIYNLSHSYLWNILEKIIFFSSFSFVRFKYSKLINRICDYIETNKVQTIISFSNPYILNVIAYYVIQKKKINFFSNYSDPIFKTGYRKYLPFTFREKSIKKIERKILESSDKIIFNNKFLAKFVLQNQNIKEKKNIKIIPHSYNETDFKLRFKSNLKHNKISVSYFGALNIIRNPFSFLDQIILLKEENKYLNFVFEFYGMRDAYIDRIIRKKEMLFKKNNIFFYNKLPYLKSIYEMSKKDILLSIDSLDIENVYLTTKIVQYLPLKKIVLNISKENSPTTELANKNNFVNINNFDKLHISNQLNELAKRYKKFKYNQSELDYYNSKNISKLWFKTINEIK